MKSKGAIDYFLGFLVGGLIILIILLVIFSFTDNIQSSNTTIIGPRTIFVPYSFSFDISKLREEKSFTLEDRNLTNGVLFGNDKLVYNIQEDALDLRINFDVTGGNFYLPFRVIVNGENIVNKPLFDGSYSFVVTDINSSALIEMEADSSSWRLWAPNLYKLSNIKFDIGRFSEVDQDFRFNITEPDRIVNGNIDFTFDENQGIFVLIFNNNTIHRDAVNDIKSVHLNKEYFIEGINKLILSADDNSIFRGRAVMAIVSEK